MNNYHPAHHHRGFNFPGDYQIGLTNSYGYTTQNIGQTVERPYRCSTCNSGFSRNHDLKRHTRIHLAVKPYPCGWCEKEFSRKDALKRHLMVKLCAGSKDVTVEESVQRAALHKKKAKLIQSKASAIHESSLSNL
ncbi:hypothetical protein BY996DRAFT_4585827 [Phakopsora pachyrhizi]|uniref:Expressed protein n=1 Tax=Phakopsora pachyrhizi TaxID=170000 RepID=A0AAV0BB04_PHAPC|nr:hypothetical protein BY996DRAFT_4589153 [Phakopsora pachyrhizi]KAI8451535.1 hypothetical protein BY996DRAFT_4585827 [Phakopsora pachyrhizi]CAH7683780.1 expressed protein [Phakopsora pachyrhizi]CAH7690737.1 expressed protein [Phakopsora pachyrhizi]